MVTYLNPNDAAHTFDLDNLYNSLRGNTTVDGGTPSKGSNALETDVASGSAYVAQDTVEFSQQTRIHDAGGTDPRFDIVYIDSNGSLQIETGTEAPAGTGGSVTDPFVDAPFKYYSPIPPDFTDFAGTPVAVVAIPAGAADYTASKHLRDVRLDPAVYADVLETRSHTLLPSYDEFSSAPQIARSVIWISGNGTPNQGVYQHDGSGYVEIGSGLSLSDIQIGSDWNVEGYGITNVSELQVNDAVRVHNGRGTFNFAGHHGQYGAGTKTEIFRFDLASDEQLEVWRIDVSPKGGGAASNDFSVEIEDDAGNTLVSAGELTTGGSSPLGTSVAGESVAGYVTNNTGGAYNATISGQVSIVQS